MLFLKAIPAGCILLILAILFSGCTLIESKDMPAVIERLADDQASGCFWIGGRGGSAVAGLPVAGGYGSGEVLLGRVNSSDTKLTIKNGECTIERGHRTPNSVSAPLIIQ